MGLYRTLLRRYRPEAFALTRRAALTGAAALIAPVAKAALPRRVIVIGAGFAGLAAAYELARAGHAVDVLEARDRIGGRVLTFRDAAFIQGRVMEGGGELIGSNHRTWIRYAAQFGLGFRTMEDVAGNEQVLLDGRLLDAKDTARLFAVLDPIYALLTRAAVAVDGEQPWTSVNAKALDSISLGTWLQRTVSQHRTGLIAKAGKADRTGAKPADWDRALALAKRAFAAQLGADNGADIANQSLLGMLAMIEAGGGEAFWTETEVWRCQQGNDALAQKLAEAIGPDRLHLRTPVAAVTEKPDQIEVADAGGKLWTADCAVLAVPPSVWPAIAFAPALQVGAIQMGVNIKFLARLRQRVWPAGRTPDALTDRMVSETWNGTDNQPGAGDTGLVGFSGGSAASAALAAYAKDRDAGFKALLGELYDGFADSYEGHRFMDWPNQDWTKAGYSSPAPGYITGFGQSLYEGTPRLKFAGEHTCFAFPGYMEGALSSGNRAAASIAAAVPERAHAKKSG